jgi:hypothetical protein
MGYRIAADAVLVAHLLFVLAVVLGGLAWLRWVWAPLVHLPVAAWGALVEFTGWLCPLTVWENALLRAAGEAGYPGGFVEHHLLALLYPEGLERGDQVLLGVLVLAANVVIYTGVWLRRRHGIDPGR